jgi:hypothetical protein
MSDLIIVLIFIAAVAVMAGYVQLVDRVRR